MILDGIARAVAGDTEDWYASRGGAEATASRSSSSFRSQSCKQRGVMPTEPTACSTVLPVAKSAPSWTASAGVSFVGRPRGRGTAILSLIAAQFCRLFRSDLAARSPRRAKGSYPSPVAGACVCV
jgi:hypothetical protein